MRTSPSELQERIAKGERVIARLQASGRPVPQEWDEHLEKLKALARQRGTLTAEDVAIVLPGSEVAGLEQRAVAEVYFNVCLPPSFQVSACNKRKKVYFDP